MQINTILLSLNYQSDLSNILFIATLERKCIVFLLYTDGFICQYIEPDDKCYVLL